ncbi:glycoside hydrolase family 43 protein [Sphingomonas sp. Y38-1Y]|uniref:glycoside hydrolase family 43 protein n=1 Tax=Sphingomonas sp. Y38-1Y TaxID=3078265 RepID=UPI0028E25A97|nr:glycoside hydrolase family 43 protein [Sphingomonas sp. Y38-1Y]
MSHIRNPILRGFNPDPSIVRVGDDFYIATSTFEWFPGVQIHHSRDLVNWRVVSRPLMRPTQLDLRGDPDSCGVWAPDLTYAHGRFWLVYTDVKRYGTTTVDGATGVSLRDFRNFVVTCDTIDGEWSDPVFLNASGFDPAFFHDEDGTTWLANMLWDHRPGRGRFAGIVIQRYDRDAAALVGEPHMIFEGTERGFTEGPHLYQRDGWYHLLVAEGGTGWNHAVVMARSRDLLGPYEVHPDGAVLTANGRREGAIARAGHGDLVELADGTPWIAYLCGRPVGSSERCILGRETAIQPMRWGEDGWLYTIAGDAEPDPAPPAPALEPAPWSEPEWDGGFDGPELPQPLQWLRTPEPARLFSLTERPGFLRLYGRDTVGSQFEQALVARRQTDFRYRASTRIEFEPRDFQAAAGLIAYYNSTKFHYLHISRDGDERTLQLMSASPEVAGGTVGMSMLATLPEGPVELSLEVENVTLRFFWRAGEGGNWQPAGEALDASILSDEATLPGLPNFTGTFVGVACQDMSGRGTPADFAFFKYEGLD